jgi:glucan phosphoethanolaminetransferase (alkaline phosphatase superfamily)
MRPNPMGEMASSRAVFSFSGKWWLFIFVTVLLPLDLFRRLGALWLALPWYQTAISLSVIVIFLTLLALTLASVSLAVSWLLNLLTRRGSAIIIALNAFVGLLTLLSSSFEYLLFWLDNLFKLENTLTITNWKLSSLYLFFGGLTVILVLSYQRCAIFKEIESIATRVFRINLVVVCLCALIISITVAYHQFHQPPAAAGYAAAGKADTRPPYPNIIIITFDGLSAGHTSVHGFIRNTTPNLAVLAQESYVCDHAYASSNWTLPSLCSLITGKYPVNHQMKNYYSIFLAESRTQNLP